MIGRDSGLDQELIENEGFDKIPKKKKLTRIRNSLNVKTQRNSNEILFLSYMHSNIQIENSADKFHGRFVTVFSVFLTAQLEI